MHTEVDMNTNVTLKQNKLHDFDRYHSDIKAKIFDAFRSFIDMIIRIGR